MSVNLLITFLLSVVLLLLIVWYTKVWTFLWFLPVMVAIYLIYIFTTSTAKGSEKAVKRANSLKYTHASAQYDRGVAGGTTTAYHRRPHTEEDSVGTDFTDGGSLEEMKGRTEADSGGTDFIDGGSFEEMKGRIEADSVGTDFTDGGSFEEMEGTPGYAYILQKLDPKGNETDFYKIEFREEPPNNDDFGSEFKMVPKSCKRVRYINKARQIAAKKLGEYYVPEKGLYKVSSSDFNSFMVQYNQGVVRIY